MFRPFIGSSSGLLWNQVSERCVHIGIPTMLTNNRNITYLTIELHKIGVIVRVLRRVFGPKRDEVTG